MRHQVRHYVSFITPPLLQGGSHVRQVTQILGHYITSLAAVQYFFLQKYQTTKQQSKVRKINIDKKETKKFSW